MVGEEKFLYAVRSNDGVSAPGLVTISIVGKPALPARLDAPDRLDFPATVVGEEVGATIELRNPGSVLVTGEITVSAPWTFEGEAAYRIEPKGKAVFRLLFRSDKPGRFTGDAVLGPDPKKTIALSAEAKAVIVAKPERLRIPGGDRGQTRMTTLELENQSDQPQTVTIAADAKLMTEKSVLLPPKGKAQVPVFAEPGDGTGFQETLHLAMGEWKLDVPVEAEPLRPHLKWTPIPAQQLKGAGGQNVAVSAWLENEGGRPVSVSLSVNAPFEIASAKETLGAGEKKEVKLTAPALAAGTHEIELTAATDSAIERLKAVFVMEAVPSTPSTKPVVSVPSPANVGEPAEPVVAAEREYPARSLENTNPAWAQIPNAKGRFDRDVGVDRATLVFPAKIGPVADLHVEERVLSIGADKKLAVNWAAIPSPKIDVTVDPRHIDLTHLEPQRVYVVRVRSGAQTLFTSQFATLPKKPFINWRYVSLGAMLAVVGYLGWRRWKARQASGW